MRRGFQDFLNDLGRATPGLPIAVSPFYSKLAERWPMQSGSGYEHHD
jgi:hypothetical protein